MRAFDSSQRVLLVADDLTGACDTGVQFAREGSPCPLVVVDDANARGEGISLPANEWPPAMVIDTESRHLASDVARARIARVLSSVAANPGYLSHSTILYKKIDSTLRGNIGAEIAGILDVFPGRVVIVAPAFPGMGRTTVDGQCLVDGVPVHQTEFGRDPVAPARTADVGAIAGCPGATVVGDPGALGPAIAEAAPGAVIVADARSDEDLKIIVAQVWPHIGDLLLVGSPGLAWAVSERLGPGAAPSPWPMPETEHPAEVRSGRPVFGVVGSLSGRSRTQLDLLLAGGEVRRIGLEADDPETAVRAAVAGLAEKRPTVLVTELSDSNAAAGHRAITAAVADVVSRIVAKAGLGSLGGLFMTGGETALAVLASLDARTIHIEKELAPAVPILSVCIRDARTPVVTKAGGFGDDEIMVRAFTYLGKGG